MIGVFSRIAITAYLPTQSLTASPSVTTPMPAAPWATPATEPVPTSAPGPGGALGRQPRCIIQTMSSTKDEIATFISASAAGGTGPIRNASASGNAVLDRFESRGSVRRGPGCDNC